MLRHRPWVLELVLVVGLVSVVVASWRPPALADPIVYSLDFGSGNRGLIRFTSDSGTRTEISAFAFTTTAGGHPTTFMLADLGYPTFFSGSTPGVPPDLSLTAFTISKRSADGSALVSMELELRPGVPDFAVIACRPFLTCGLAPNEVFLLSVDSAARSIGPGPSFASVFSNSVTTGLESRTNVFGTQSLFFAPSFTPNLGLSLAEAAALFGYDHFNWLQIVQSLPRLDDPSDPRNPGTLDQNGNLPRVPFFDAVSGGYAYQLASCGLSLSFPVRDARPWYLDETFDKCGRTLVVGSQFTTILNQHTIDTNGDGVDDTLQVLGLLLCEWVSGGRKVARMGV